MKRHKLESVDEFGRRALLSKIAEQKGYTYSTRNGLSLVSTGAVIGNNPNTVAKLLLGQLSTEKDIATTESIVNVIVRLTDYEQLVENIRPVLTAEGIILPTSPKIVSNQTGTPEWFRKLMQIVG